MNDILKNWKTTLVGLAILGYAGFQAYQTGTVNVNEVIGALIGAGFILGKDANKSHTQK